MAGTEGRKAKVGVAVTVLLMVCVVMFIGSLFYLTVEGPWNMESEIETIPISLPIVETPKERYEPESIEDAMLDLSDAGCTIVSSSIDFETYKMEYTSYNDFKEKVLKSHIVIIAEIEDETLLLVFKNRQLWFWKP